MESTSVSNDRLRKAIERNRAKQTRRSPKIPNDLSTDLPASGWSSRRSAAKAPKTSAARRTVAHAEEVEFTTAIRKSPRKAPAPVGYATSRSVVKTSPVRRKTRSKKFAKGQSFLLKAGWIFAGILLVRLVLSNDGVIDYYDRKELIQNKYTELKSFKLENEALVVEIEKIKKSPRYQRKIVRDHLGFIAKDEFLILFQKGSETQAI